MAIGASKLPLRRTYKLWEEDVPPTVVFEVTSRSTRRDDLSKKRALYARLGVKEYYLYDPLAEYLKPSLQGFVLAGAYQPLPPAADGSLTSAALGLRLKLAEGHLRLFDAATGALLLSPAEHATAMEARIAEMERRLADLERRADRADKPA